MCASSISSSSSSIRAFFRAMLSAVIAVSLFTFGCSDGGDDDTPIGNISNGENDAWVNCDNVVCAGYAFRDGKVFVILEVSDTWFQNESGTYTTNGSNISMTVNTIEGVETLTGQYAVSKNGDTLTIVYSETSSRTEVYIRTVITKDDDGEDDDPTPPLTGGDFANGSDDIWELCETGYGFESCTGLAFQNGTIYFGAEFIDGLYFLDAAGTYTASGNTLTINYDYMGETESRTAAYGVSGNQLTLDYGNGDVDVYTRRTGLTIVTLEEVCQDYVEMGMFDNMDECFDMIGGGGGFFKRSGGGGGGNRFALRRK